MRSKKVIFIAFFAAAGLALHGAEKLSIVPTFENASVYLDAEGDGFTAEYRRQGGESWRPAPRLVRTVDDPVWRGSLLKLAENAAYDMRIRRNGEIVAEQSFRTQNPDPPIARTIRIGPSQVKFSENGRSDGWIRLIADDPLDAGLAREAALELREASYVIVENITTRGGRRHGIRIENCHNIIIRNCDIGGYGRHGVLMFQYKYANGRFFDHDGQVVTHDAGISLRKASDVLIEHCYIREGRTRSVAWAMSHPTGSAAIDLNELEGRIIVRYNDCVGTRLHPHDDVILSDNQIGINSDADVYGNLLMGSNDDAIELDGNQRNVRFYDNLCLSTLCGPSTAPCYKGPTYIFNNLITHGGTETGTELYSIKNTYGRPGQGTIFAVGNTLRYAIGIGRFRVRNGESSRIEAHNNVIEAANGIFQETLMDSDSVPGRNLCWSSDMQTLEDAREMLAAHADVSDPVFTAPEYVDADVGDFRLQKGS